MLKMFFGLNFYLCRQRDLSKNKAKVSCTLTQFIKQQLTSMCSLILSSPYLKVCGTQGTEFNLKWSCLSSNDH